MGNQESCFDGLTLVKPTSEAEFRAWKLLLCGGNLRRDLVLYLQMKYFLMSSYYVRWMVLMYMVALQVSFSDPKNNSAHQPLCAASSGGRLPRRSSVAGTL